MKIFTLVFLVVLFFYNCNENDSNTKNETTTAVEVNGFSNVESNQSYDATISTLSNALSAAGPISVVAQIDHTANAQSVGQTLNNTSVILFGNPTLGTPLMQNNQLAGLDLPQKYLIYQDEDVVRVAYNSTAYLSQRHGLDGEESLTTIQGALNNFIGMTSSSDVFEGTTELTIAQGITTKISANTFDVTYDKLFTAIDANANLSIVAEVNHQANATAVGLELAPTRLIIFGNPNLGTPLMQSSQTVGIDLPQKMLVWEAEGVVNVSYNTPEYLAERHKLEGVDMQLSTISTALNNLSNAAISQ